MNVYLSTKQLSIILAEDFCEWRGALRDGQMSDF